MSDSKARIRSSLFTVLVSKVRSRYFLLRVLPAGVLLTHVLPILSTRSALGPTSSRLLTTTKHNKTTPIILTSHGRKDFITYLISLCNRGEGKRNCGEIPIYGQPTTGVGAAKSPVQSIGLILPFQFFLMRVRVRSMNVGTHTEQKANSIVS